MAVVNKRQRTARKKPGVTSMVLLATAQKQIAYSRPDCDMGFRAMDMAVRQEPRVYHSGDGAIKQLHGGTNTRCTSRIGAPPRIHSPELA
jgi:hypothetical protein